MAAADRNTANGLTDGGYSSKCRHLGSYLALHIAVKWPNHPMDRRRSRSG